MQPIRRARVIRDFLTWFSAVLGLALLCSCGKSPFDTPKQPTPPEQGKSGTGILIETTAAVRLDFNHQLADGKMDNIMESDGAGGVILDFDNDGWPDVYFVNSGPAPILSDAPAFTKRWPNKLFRNRGNGTFEDVTTKAGVAGHGFGTTAAAADYDNDGNTDLLVVNFDGLILYHNQGNGTFKDVTQEAGLNSTRAGISATFFDADGDGLLDIFVANYLRYDPKVKVPPGTKAPYPGPLSYEPEFNILYHNKGDGTFEDVSERAGIRIPGHRGMSVAPLDYDLDGDQDLYVCNDGTPNLLLANDGKGHFAEVAVQAGVGLNQFGEAAGSMGAAVGDCNGDGLPDMFVTRFGNASLYLNSRGGFFEDRIQASGILEVSSRYTGWGGNFLDFDNDGDLDLFIANGHAHFLQGMPRLLFENRGSAAFADVSQRAGPFFQKLLSARGSMAWDYDNDGRIDLVLTTLGGPVSLLRNVLTNGNHWVKLELEGARGNRDGFGAQVRLTSGGTTQYAEARCPTSYVSQQDARLHFGLGKSASIDKVEIRWPGGQTQTLTGPEPDRIHLIREPGASRWKTGN